MKTLEYAHPLPETAVVGLQESRCHLQVATGFFIYATFEKNADKARTNVMQLEETVL